MKGIIKGAKIKEYIVGSGDRKGQKFKKLNLKFECINSETGLIKTRYGSFGIEFAKTYFSQCGKTLEGIVDEIVDVKIDTFAYTDKNGEERRTQKVSFFNFLDAEGKPIPYKKEEDASDLKW